MWLERIRYQPWHESTYNRNCPRDLCEPFHRRLTVKARGYGKHSAWVESAHESSSYPDLLVGITNVEDEQPIRTDSENVPFHIYGLDPCADVEASRQELFEREEKIFCSRYRFPILDVLAFQHGSSSIGSRLASWRRVGGTIG